MNAKAPSFNPKTPGFHPARNQRSRKEHNVAVQSPGTGMAAPSRTQLQASASAFEMQSRGLGDEKVAKAAPHTQLHPSAVAFEPKECNGSSAHSRTAVLFETKPIGKNVPQTARLAPYEYTEYFSCGRNGMDRSSLHQSAAVAPAFIPSYTQPVSLDAAASCFVPQNTTVATVCRFYLQGMCTKGLDCPFSHNPEDRKNKVVGGEDGSILDEHEEFSLSTTEYRVEEGITCCFGPGLTVVRLDLGMADSESSPKTKITISSLPRTAVEARDVEARLSPFGRLSSLTLQNDAQNTQYAVATFHDKLCAERAVGALHGSPVSSWVGVVTSTRKKKIPQNEKRHIQHGSVLVAFKRSIRSGSSPSGLSMKVQWYAPSRCAWLQYPHAWQATKTAKILQGKAIHGRIITPSHQTPLKQVKWRPSSQSVPTVWIGNLPPETTACSLKREVQKLARFQISSVSLSNPQFDEKSTPGTIQGLLRKFGPIASIDFQNQEKGQTKRKALVRFIEVRDAEEACSYFHQHPQINELGGGKLFLQPIYSFKHSLPRDIFQSLRPLLDSKLTAVASRSGIRTNFIDNQRVASVTMLVTGDSPEAIEELRVALRPIMNGEVVRDPKDGNKILWNRRILRSRQLQETYIKMGRPGSSAVWVDLRRQELRIFGLEPARRDLKNWILEHTAASAVQLSTISLPMKQFEFIIFSGRDILDKLSRATGAKKVSLDVKRKALLFEGDAEDATKAKTVIEKLMGKRGEIDDEDDGTPCPVCFCSPDDPTVELSCGHVLCHECFSSWLSNCSSNDFPVVCVAEGCKTPIDLGCLKKHLSSEMLNRLYSFAVDDHVRKNTDSLQFCVSPTCPGIYQISPAAEEGTCSTCQTKVCLECKLGHDGMTCADYRLASQPPDALRMKVIDEILTLQCPRCHQAFLDFTGCFALRCSSCPCAFCGWCLKDCGSDAHDHVMNACNAKPHGHRDYFGTFDQFQTAQRKNRRTKLIEFLSTLNSSDREKCVSSLGKDLADLGIQV